MGRFEKLLGHGGYFKTPVIGQKLMAAATNTPVSVMESASEGGPWGMALLSAYLVQKSQGQSLEDYLNNSVFADKSVTTIEPDENDINGFNEFMKNYVAGLEIQKTAVNYLI